ncbi:MAG: hypothetical protein U0176_02655 [Bacteroidia bacterium]
MAIVLLVAQKKSKTDDSPARYGCRIWIENEDLSLHPVDPNAGDGPIDSNEDVDDDHHGRVVRDIFHEAHDEIRDDPAEFPTEAPVWNFHAKRYAVYKIGNQSDIARPGDYVIEFEGAGFVASEGTPKVHLGDSILLEDSHVGPEGKLLIVILPKEVASNLDRRVIQEFAIQNPGGLERSRERWARVPVLRGTLLDQIKNAETKNFVQGAYFLEMK